MKSSDKLIYYEKVTSKRTETLFLALVVIFSLFCIWRVIAVSMDILAVVFFGLSVLFIFYSVNFRTLIIRLTDESLRLTFGIFTWTVPLDNIETCQLDDNLPALMEYGGAGIHFMLIRKRYRASFNFLEHSRVVIGLKRKVGPVRDISFTTCQPIELIQRIQGAISARKVA
jgi:hypothetical protein